MFVFKTFLTQFSLDRLQVYKLTFALKCIQLANNPNLSPSEVVQKWQHFGKTRMHLPVRDCTLVLGRGKFPEEDILKIIENIFSAYVLNKTQLYKDTRTRQTQNNNRFL